MYCRVLNWMSTDVSEVHAASITRAIQLTLQYIPEDSELHTGGRENLKSHIINSCRMKEAYQYLYSDVIGY
jgi:hypothetical protein